jgi:hypothetical protein
VKRINFDIEGELNENFDIYDFYYYYWVDTSAGGLLVHQQRYRPSDNNKNLDVKACIFNNKYI